MDQITTSNSISSTTTASAANISSSKPQVESKLFLLTSIDIKDPLDALLEESFNKLQATLLNQQLSDSQLHNELIQYSNQSKQHSDEVCNALLYSILIDSTNSSLRYLRYLLLCSTNNASTVAQTQNAPPDAAIYGNLITNLTSIALENYTRLLDLPRQQYLWLLRELIKARFTNIDKVLAIQIRNIQGGNLNEKNLWLNEQILDILVDNPEWLYSNVELMQTALYTYLRLIADHIGFAYSSVRQREVDFCIQLMREKWNDCVQIGRDLIRLLQNLAKIPDFEQFWKDLVNSPQTLSQQFANAGGLLHALRLPTRRRFLISRLTPDMERKIFYLITNVKFGNHKRYQDWFQRQYLSTPESQSIRVDIIRYICVVVHPTNEQLNAGLTPRWAVIGWLLNTCTNLVESANCKLALFYDWLFYDVKKDNIMLVEPGILLMSNSLRVHTNITIMLLDFLSRIVYTYYVNFKDNIVQGISTAFKDILDKRVIPSVNVFFESGKLEKEFKLLLAQTFPLIFGGIGLQTPSTPPPQIAPQEHPFKRSTSSNDIVEPPHQPLLPPTPPLSSSASSSMHNIDEIRVGDSATSVTSGLSTPAFSDDESEVGVTATGIATSQASDLQIIDSLNSKLILNDMQITKPMKIFVNEEIVQINLEASLTSLNNESLSKKLISFDKTQEVEAQCQIIDDILNEFLNNDEFFTSEQIKALADCLLYHLKVNFTNNLLPDTYYQKYQLNDNDESLDESINKRPVFLLFKYLQQQTLSMDQSSPGGSSTSKSSSNLVSKECKKLLELIKQIHFKQKRLSYYYLYYIKVNNDEEYIQNYRELVKFIISEDNSQTTKAAQKQHQNSTLQATQQQQNDLKKEKQEFEKFLLEDMKQCQLDDSDLFCFMISFIYKNFSPIVTNNSEMIFLIVNCIDSIQCKNLLAMIISDELKLVKPTNQTSLKFTQCLFNSLQWETVEQIFFWKLLFAHNNITIENLLPLVPKLDSIKHCEAICDLFQILKLEDLSVEIVQSVLCRKEDNITRALFIYWAKTEDHELKKIFIKLLDKLYSHLTRNLVSKSSTIAPNKKQQLLELEMPSLEHVLAHLNQLRVNNDCLKLILDEKVQEKLQNLYKSYCNDDLKRRYADLFTLIDEFDVNTLTSASNTKKSATKTTTATTTTNKKTQQTKSGASLTASSDKAKTTKRVKTTTGSKSDSKKGKDSSSSSDSDIEDVAPGGKQPPKKKRKPMNSDNESD